MEGRGDGRVGKRGKQEDSKSAGRGGQGSAVRAFPRSKFATTPLHHGDSEQVGSIKIATRGCCNPQMVPLHATCHAYNVNCLSAKGHSILG